MSIQIERVNGGLGKPHQAVTITNQSEYIVEQKPSSTSNDVPEAI